MVRHQIKIKIKEAFGNLYRLRHVLIACKDKEGNILVGEKPNFYPKGISRLLGGGIGEDEDIIDATLRELEEELGVKAKKKDLVKIGEFEVKATDNSGKKFKNKTYLFFINIKNEKYKAGDDVKKIQKLTLKELSELSKKYDELDENFWYEGEEGRHSWGDYGKVYGPIHRIVYEEIKKKNL